MGKIVAEISVSLDGYVAGPSPTLENPLGEGGDQLHEWVFPLKSWREPHGLPGGETGPDDELVAESLRATGAVVMGRRMFSGGEGPWENDTNASWSQAERTRSTSRSMPDWSTSSCSTSPRCCWAAARGSSTASGPRSPGSR